MYAVVDHRRHANDIRGDDRQAGRHRLQQGIRQPVHVPGVVVDRGEEEEVGGGEEGRDAVALDPSGEEDAVGQP